MQTHLKGLLAAARVPSVEHLRDLRDDVTVWFGLDVDDVFLPGEPVTVGVQAKSLLDVGTLSEVEATVSVTDEASGAEVLRRQLVVSRDATDVELGLLPPSSYLVRVGSGHGSAQVSDVFVVAGPEDATGP